MSYRGIQPNRIILQTRQIMTDAGHSLLWREFISATTANDVIGLGDTYHYRETWVSAHMTFKDNVQTQEGGGQVISQTLKATSDYQFGDRDELVWLGVTYRVDSDNMPAKVGNQWTVKLDRGE